MVKADNVENIFTRFVIIEKNSDRGYFTPLFDRKGNVVSKFVSPGIYTSEIDISSIILSSYNLIIGKKI